MTLTKDMQRKIVFSVALSEDDRANAVAYIEATMRERFGCDPPPTVGLICVARVESKIVGSLVLQSSEEHVPFPIERHYAFNVQKTPFPFSREKIVLATRWTATLPEVSLEILRNAFKLAYGFGKRFVLIEAKPYSIKRLGELGIVCKEISNAELLKEEVLKEVGVAGMNYYNTSPIPTLYLIELSQLC